MLVKHIMSKDFETISRDQMLDDVVETMLRNDANHIVVLNQDDPFGIITRRKVIIACYKTDFALSEIPVSGFAPGFEDKVGPNTTVLLSVGKIQRAKTDCVPVIDGVEVEGVLTKDDVIDNVSNITADILESENRREEWVDQ